MNLYFRLFFAICRGLFKKRMDLGETVTRQYRVLLNDIDINGHMNNGRYTQVVDLLLMEALLRTKLLVPALKRGWIPAMGGNIVSYRKQMKLFDPYTVSFRMCAWDDKWTFFEYEFRNKKDQVVTKGYAKGAFVGKGGLVPIETIEEKLNLKRPEHTSPSAIPKWLLADEDINQAA